MHDETGPRQRLLGRRRFITGGVAAGVGTLAAGGVPSIASAAEPQPGDGSMTATNVRDYGATGDGTTDDTAAIQRAVEACRARGGGLVYLPTGRYAITGIQLGNAIDLVGENHNTAVLLFTADSGNAVEVIGGGFNRLAHFQILYDRKASDGAAIYLKRTFTVDIDGVFVQGGNAGHINAHDGIVADECTATFIRNFNVYFCQNDGIRVNGPGGNDTYIQTGVINLGQSDAGAAIHLQDYGNGAVNITDAEVLLGEYSLLADGSNYMRFVDSYFDSSKNGVHLRSGNLITFTGCWFSNRPGPGLTIGAARSVSVVGCHVTNCGTDGIRIIDGARYVTLHATQVVGNNTSGEGGDGIRIDGGDMHYVSVVGCSCGNDKQVAILQTVGQDVGIRVTDKVRGARYIVTDNVLFDNRVAGLVDEGTGPKRVVNNLT